MLINITEVLSQLQTPSLCQLLTAKVKTVRIPLGYYRFRVKHSYKE